ncbi:hypothetical protein C1646_675907 [Rhizophagus diaphanus]|nr:hypothetical protein C1646_675907 [Rhizophagus diaphanus] [Rhizophagus sp. MUCL 43196]
MIYTKLSFDTAVQYNELPNLCCVKKVKNKHVTEEVFNTLGQIFFAYHIQNIFGLTLLHKHFLLEGDEILLQTGSLSDFEQKTISQPVKVDKLLFPIQGSNWKITSDKSYMPYEFKLEDEDKKIDLSTSKIHSFLEEFSGKLNELNLTNIFGICAIGKDSFIPSIESTEGRKNITVPFTDSDKSENCAEAVWRFKPCLNNKEKKIITQGYFLVCLLNCWGCHSGRQQYCYC